MHKLMHKGLKKKKKSKKGKKGAEEEEFDPEELERYRRERAEALVNATSEANNQISGDAVEAAGSDEWKKFQVLTAGVDSILKKTQGDLDRIKSTSFFQRKIPVVEENKAEEDPTIAKNKAKRWIGFDKDGNPIEQQTTNKDDENIKDKLSLSETGFVEIPDDDNDDDDSTEDDIFDTTYVDVLQNIDVQLAYIPDSPTDEQCGDDPFDTTNADKVLKTVDKHGKKVVSLGNAVEVLSGRIDHVSTCKISRPIKGKIGDLLLDNFDTNEVICESAAEPIEIEKTLLDQDDNSDIYDVPIDLTNLTIHPQIVKPDAYTYDCGDKIQSNLDAPLDISEFEILNETKILEGIPDLDDEFDTDGLIDEKVQLDYASDPFAEKECADAIVDSEIIEVSFESATFVNEEDPFDTTFAENLVPGKAELKFIEKELDEFAESTVSISLTDSSGLHFNYETGSLIVPDCNQFTENNQNLLGGSITDLTQFDEQSTHPIEEIARNDPLNTCDIQQIITEQTELKYLEEANNIKYHNQQGDNFHQRKEDILLESSQSLSSQNLHTAEESNLKLKSTVSHGDVDDVVSIEQKRKPSRPELLGTGPLKIVAFELPTPSQRPDLLITSDEEKLIASKPLTPYYSQKSLEDSLPEHNIHNIDIDPFDTSFVSKVTPGKTELKLIESELLNQETIINKCNNESVIDVQYDSKLTTQRRQSDYGSSLVARPKSLKFCDSDESLINDNKDINKSILDINEKAHQIKLKTKRQESLLDAEIAVDAKPLTPRIESKVLKDDVEDVISYIDPFDTSIANNILPGKAELKQLESELCRIPLNVHPINIVNSIDFTKVTINNVPITLENDDSFDPHADEIVESQDFLSLSGDNFDDKVLTPLHEKSYSLDDSVDPFDTSFAVIGPGKAELKLLESELMDK